MTSNKVLLGKHKVLTGMDSYMQPSDLSTPRTSGSRLAPSLCHGHQDRLVVAGAAEDEDTIYSRGEASGYGGRATTFAVFGVVDA